MKNIKILITGATGFVGQVFSDKISQEYTDIEVVRIGFCRKNEGVISADLSQLDETKRLIESVNPTHVFHFAAMVNPKLNEENKSESYRKNFIITNNLVAACSQNTTIYFLSTDKVYDSSNKNAHELDVTKIPDNFYSLMKIICENIINSKFSKHFILICPIIHSLGDTNSNSLVNISKYLTNEKFIYLSTDYVFDGHKGLYKENDTTNPNTIYGKSKLLGETNSLTYFSNPIVVRTSGVYGKGCKWIEWLLTTSDKEISCFIDVYNSPTYVYDLAEMIINVIKQDFRGIVNLAGSDVVNRYELYSEVFKYKKNTITNLTKGTSNNTFPKNISLDVSLYRGIVNKTPMSIEQGLKALFNEN